MSLWWIARLDSSLRSVPHDLRIDVSSILNKSGRAKRYSIFSPTTPGPIVWFLSEVNFTPLGLSGAHCSGVPTTQHRSPSTWGRSIRVVIYRDRNDPFQRAKTPYIRFRFGRPFPVRYSGPTSPLLILGGVRHRGVGRFVHCSQTNTTSRSPSGL